MKRKTLWTVVGLVVVLIIVVAAAARANFRAGHGWCGHGGWHRGGPLSYVSHELKLNDTQISEVHAIWNEERPTVAGLLKEMVDGAHQMEDATSGGKFDEAKVHEIATTEGNTFSRLLVEKEHIKLRIYSSVLNEEQRQSADRLQQRGLDHVVSRLQKQNQ